ncbi:putative PurR-regulated permease PerM [Paenibacillus endophyticus]|uniref:Putative PurR-regulated permease PerM n=1 Tax=Paenibacillus endophyticus TaxID=1294268 RepID=A0A7W5GAL2_9BACL|nr:AI-2E family transporter [Paenibacillus endophyticus]MBB3152891.1 putative PurR-regulated permease PerM [Paenibacillus endophyticus]
MENAKTGTDRFKRFILNNKFVLFLLVLLLVGLNIMVLTKISYIFTPVTVLLKTLLLPVILAGIAYYLLNPIVDHLERNRIKRVYSIILLFLVGAGLITILLVAVIPFLNEQAVSFVNNFPKYGDQLRKNFEDFMDSPGFMQIQEWFNLNPSELSGNITEQATSLLNGTLSSVGSFVGAIKEVFLAIVTLPFILFYLLKDGKHLPQAIVRFLPNQLQPQSKRIMAEMNGQISSYIRGQIIVSFCIGMLLYIGYLIIGLEYSLVLALVAACTSVIPYLGPAIAITPALVVALVTSPVMLLKMIVIWTIVQLIEGKFISPQIMGKSLQIHPITIIFVILTAGNLFGLAGIVLAVPGYAVLKVIVIHLYDWFTSRSSLYKEDRREDQLS